MDDPTVIGIQRDRVRLRYKVTMVGQSQQDTMLLAAAPRRASPSRLQFGSQRARMIKYHPVDVGVRGAGDLSYASAAIAERLAANAPTVPFMICNCARSGESLSSFYGDG